MERLNLSMFQPTLLANLQLESTLVTQIVEAQRTNAGITHIKRVWQWIPLRVANLITKVFFGLRIG
jgi:hypothetical protein